MKRWLAIVAGCAGVVLAPVALRAGPLANGELSVGTGGASAPDRWFSWNDGSADPQYGTYRSASNSWEFWNTAGIFQDIYATYYTPTSSTFYAGDLVQAGGYLYNLLGNYCYGNIEMEFWNTEPTNPVLLYTLVCARITQWGGTNAWVAGSSKCIVPDSTTVIRIVVRYDTGGTNYPAQGRFYADDIFFTNLDRAPVVNFLKNPVLNGSLAAPDRWQQWNDGSHDAWFDVYRTLEQSWCFWWDGGIYQDVAAAFAPGFNLEYGAYFLHPSWDALRGGTKRGLATLEFYNGATRLASYDTPTNINATGPTDTWLPVFGAALPPTNATAARVVIRCTNWASGDGRFMADDAALRYRTTAITTTTPPVRASACASACIIQSNPAVAYWTYSTYGSSISTLMYARCSNAEGTGSWTTRVVHTAPAYYWGAPFPSMTLVQGNPAIAVRAYPNDGDLYYFRCSTANGMGAWTSVVVDVTNYNTGVDATLLVVNGKPSISSLSDRYGLSGREIRYYRSGTNTGVGAWTARTLATGPTGVYTRTCIGNMGLVGSLPAIACQLGGERYSASAPVVNMLLLSTNVNGDGVWRTNIIHSATNAIMGRPWFAMVSGRPAVAYVFGTSTNNLSVRYAVNSAASGTGTWSIVTVATNVGREVSSEWSSGDWYYPIRLSVQNGKPAIAYVSNNDPWCNVAYAVSATTNGLGSWTSYDLVQGGFVGSLLQHNSRPLIVHEGVWGVRLTR